MKRLLPLIGWLIGLVAVVVARVFNLLGLGEGIQILIMFGLLLLTAQYAQSAFEQANANKQMVGLGKREQEWAMRPYISVKGEISEETVPSKKLDYVRLSLMLTNQGRTPTKNVTVNYEFQSEKQPIIIQKGDFICEDLFGESPCICIFELSDEMRSRLEQNEKIRFKIEVMYRSVFEKEHHTIYKWWRNAPTEEWITEQCEWT